MKNLVLEPGELRPAPSTAPPAPYLRWRYVGVVFACPIEIPLPNHSLIGMGRSCPFLAFPRIPGGSMFRSFLTMVIAACWAPGSLSAAELGKLEATLRKQPAYKSKTPK